MTPKIDPDSYLDDEFDTGNLKQRNRRSGQSLALRQGKRKRVKFLAEIADLAGKTQVDLEEGFIPTFSPSEHERSWVLSYLEEFYNTQIITDVLRKIKGGKEANVYCCAAHPSTGLNLIAAKVYRPRMFRNLRNDARYRLGRDVLDGKGKVARDRRGLLAIKKNTRYGKELRHTSWLEHEYQTLQLLYEAGADVPRPLAHGNSVILMEYIGEIDSPAPTLNQVTLNRTEARTIYNRLLENIEIMLSVHRVHADLSAYNVLYWDGHFKIIDFPQSVDPRRNPDAYPIFIRDVERICQYFNRYGIVSQIQTLAAGLWEKYQFSNALDAEDDYNVEQDGTTTSL